MSVAAIVAVNWVGETNVVVRSAPFQRTTELTTKEVPFTDSVNGPPPAGAEAGLMLLAAGMGLLVLMTVKVCGLEIPAPGLNTTTSDIPPTAMSTAGIAAVSRVADTNVVLRSKPFQRTTELLAKLVPFTVSTKLAPPAVAVDGAMLDVTGSKVLLFKSRTDTLVEVLRFPAASRATAERR